MGYKPKKAMVIQFIDESFVEGDTYAELVATIFRQRGEDYAGSEKETQWQMRADLAEGWLTAAAIEDMSLQGHLDFSSEESLIVSAARAGWLILYDNVEAVKNTDL